MEDDPLENVREENDRAPFPLGFRGDGAEERDGSGAGLVCQVVD
jgi:hypothetical protein